MIWFFTVGQAIAFVPLISRWTSGVDLPTEPLLLTATSVGLVLPTIVIAWRTLVHAAANATAAGSLAGDELLTASIPATAQAAWFSRFSEHSGWSPSPSPGGD